MAGLAAAAPMHEGQIIFPLQGKHVHGSSIAQLPNGDLLAVWFHGSGERSAPDVQIQGARLKKGASEWSPVFQMADTPGLPDCNPVLFLDRNDTLWLFWIRVVANRWEHSLLMYRKTTDYLGEGPPNWDWQDAITLIPGEEFLEQLKAGLREARVDSGMWAEYARQYSKMLVEAAEDKRKRQTGWMTRAQPIQLDSGRILVPLYSDGFNTCLAAISDDDGKTWRASGPMVGAGPIQPTFTTKKDGTIVAYFRDSGGAPGRVQWCESKDNGETWTVTQDTEFPNPGSSLAALTLEDGTWAILYNDTERGRHSLALGLSDDEGKTWKWTRHLDQAEYGSGGSYEYPTLIQTPDGMLHTSYTYKEGGDKKSIKHAAFNVDWVKQGD
jgi:predicted neuraminidase